MKYVTKELIDQYGPEFFENVALVVRGQTEGMLGSAKAEQDARVAEQLSALQAENMDRQFWAEAERLEPGAKAINGDQHVDSMDGWAAYLDTPIVPGGSATWRDEAQKAINANNAAAFVQVIRGFKAARPDLFIPKTQAPRPTVEEQTVPASTVGTPPPTDTPGGKRMIPQSELTKFQQDAGKGIYTPADADKKLKEYQLALTEGRILAGA